MPQFGRAKGRVSGLAPSAPHEKPTPLVSPLCHGVAMAIQRKAILRVRPAGFRHSLIIGFISIMLACCGFSLAQNLMLLHVFNGGPGGGRIQPILPRCHRPERRALWDHLLRRKLPRQRRGLSGGSACTTRGRVDLLSDLRIHRGQGWMLRI